MANESYMKISFIILNQFKKDKRNKFQSSLTFFLSLLNHETTIVQPEQSSNTDIHWIHEINGRNINI